LKSSSEERKSSEIEVSPVRPVKKKGVMVGLITIYLEERIQEKGSYKLSFSKKFNLLLLEYHFYDD